jgi:alkaline phosphatase D
MSPFDQQRRVFLRQAARLAGATALSLAYPGLAASKTRDWPFGLGVASGAPLPDRIMLWTRLVPRTITGALDLPLPVKLRWEVADDEQFHKIVSSGEVTALPQLGHSVHVDAHGLAPDRWYWYRFRTADALSPAGRTRTAPAAQATASALRFAVASCQHWEFGHYAAHRHIANAHVDLVAFLGDYIYEWGPYDLQHPDTPRRSDPSISLNEYRNRYAQYKSDANLQAAHHAAPWIVTWDDHEVANDYSGARDERMGAAYLTRRAAAYQAFYEHMPVRLQQIPAPGKAFAHMRIYERYDWGQLARFHVLDNRQYRALHACQPSDGGSSSVTNAACPERLQAGRTLLGAEQEAWLAQGMAQSKARWNFIAQQTLMAQSSQIPVEKAGDGRFWTDGWDGYPDARDRLFADIARHRPSNPVVLSGDVHTFYASELRRDFYRPASADNPVLATEFCSTSITSSSRPQARTDQYVGQNPHTRYGRSDRRGFILAELSAARLKTSFIGLENVHAPDSKAEVLASFLVESGKAGLTRLD